MASNYTQTMYAIIALSIIAIITLFGGITYILLYGHEINLYSILPFILFIILAAIIIILVFLQQFIALFSIGGSDGSSDNISKDIGPLTISPGETSSPPLAPSLQILKDPVSISQTTYYVMKQNHPTSANYTFGFWFYAKTITTPITNNGFMVFNYGYATPFIMYSTNNNLYIYGSSSLASSNKYSLLGTPDIHPIQPQKWNYIVIQYVGGNSVQYYINCNLIATISFDSQTQPTYDTTEQITVNIGYNDPTANGVGAVANVKYYTTPLTNVDMQNEYSVVGEQLSNLGMLLPTPTPPPVGQTLLILKDPVSISRTTYYRINQNPPTSANYTFGFWFYANTITTPIPNKNLGFKIFNYGNVTPFIMYSTNNNLYILGSSYLANSDNYSIVGTPVTYPIIPQKWNYIVVQYVGGNSVQYYINCNLKANIYFHLQTQPTYDTTEQITVTIGNDDPAANGVGAVANVKYYTTPLTNDDMQKEYSVVGSELSILGVPQM
jgi:hypothetical protein